MVERLEKRQEFAGCSKTTVMISYIACSKTKHFKKCPAKYMYRGALFKKSYCYCLIQKYEIYILSAKYGLLHPEDIIEPYEMTLNSMNIKDRRDWSQKIILSIKERGLFYSPSIMFAGNNYSEFLNLPNATYPLKGLSQGKQLQWFTNKQIKNRGFFK